MNKNNFLIEKKRFFKSKNLRESYFKMFNVAQKNLTVFERSNRESINEEFSKQLLEMGA